MSYFCEDDIDGMLSDSPHSMTVGAVSKNVWFDESDDVELDEHNRSAGQVVRIATILYKTSDFPSLKIGDELTLSDEDGSTPRNFKVAARLAQGDGATTLIHLGQ